MFRKYSKQSTIIKDVGESIQKKENFQQKLAWMPHSDEGWAAESHKYVCVPFYPTLI